MPTILLEKIVFLLKLEQIKLWNRNIWIGAIALIISFHDPSEVSSDILKGFSIIKLDSSDLMKMLLWDLNSDFTSSFVEELFEIWSVFWLVLKSYTSDE